MTELNVGGTKLSFHTFNTLGEAIAASKSGDVISINHSIVVDRAIKIDNAITLNFNDNIVRVPDNVLGFDLINGTLTIQNANVIIGQQSNFIRKSSPDRATLNMKRVEIAHDKMKKGGYYPGLVLYAEKGPLDLNLNLANCGIDFIICNVNNITINNGSNIGNSVALSSRMAAKSITINDSQVNNSILYTDIYDQVIKMKNVSTNGGLVTYGNIDIYGFTVDPLSLNDEPEVINSDDKLRTWNQLRDDFGQPQGAFALTTNSYKKLKSQIIIKKAQFDLTSLKQQKSAYDVLAWFNFLNCDVKIADSDISETLSKENVQFGGELSITDTDDAGQWKKNNVQQNSNYNNVKSDSNNHDSSENTSAISINHHNYSSIEEAVQAAKNDDVIEVSKNINVSNVNIDKNITISGVNDGVTITIPQSKIGFNQMNGKLKFANLTLQVGNKSNALVDKQVTNETTLILDNVVIKHLSREHDTFYPSLFYLVALNSNEAINATLEIIDSKIDYIFATFKRLIVKNSKIGDSITAISQLIAGSIVVENTNLSNLLLNNTGNDLVKMHQIKTEVPLIMSGNFEIDGLEIIPIDFRDGDRSQLVEIRKPFDLDMNRLLRLPADNYNKRYAINSVNLNRNSACHITIKHFKVADLDALSNQYDLLRIVAWFNVVNTELNVFDSKIPKTLFQPNINNVSKVTYTNVADVSNWNVPVNNVNNISSSKNESQDALAKLNEMIGLKSVKREIKSIIDLTKVNRSRNDDSLINLNLVFEGNPGTGKTVVARLFSQALYQNGVIKTPKFEEISATQMLERNGAMAAANTRRIINNAIDGVLFIDEAYSLDPSEDNTGIVRQMMDQFIKSISDIQGSNNGHQLIVIMAGYTDKMEHFFENSNIGLSSRFSKSNRIEFPDYNDDELLDIFKLDLKKEHLKCDAASFKVISEVVKRLYRAHKTTGNGRFVKEELIERLKKVQASRLSKIGIDNTNREQRITIDAEDARLAMSEVLKANDMNVNPNGDNSHDALDKLDSLIGLGSVKKQIKDIIISDKVNRVRTKKMGNKPESLSSINMVFEGNPGTGKTEVARLVAKALFQDGVLDTDHVQEVGAGDLTAKYVGQSDKKTDENIQKALGGVLFIDEAYYLAPSVNGNDFNDDIIKTLMKDMDKYKDQLVVIMAGYKEQMESFLRNANPGLKSRFPITIDFPDYDIDELMDIYKLKINNASFHSTDGANKVVLSTLEKLNQYHKINGNGRFISNFVIPNLKRTQSIRISETGNINNLSSEELNTITEEDAKSAMKNLLVNNGINIDNSKSNETKNDDVKTNINSDPIDDLNSLVKSDKTKFDLIKIINLTKVNKFRESNQLPTVPLNFNFVFIGNQLTKQKKLAQLYADVLNKLGIISNNQLTEINGNNPTLSSRSSSVLFIENANSLSEPVINNTLNDYAVVIISGEEQPIREFINANSQLQSQFPNKAIFRGIDKEECVNHFVEYLASKGVSCDEDARKLLRDGVNWRKFKDSDHGDEKENELFTKLMTAQSLRCMSMMSDINGTDLTDEQKQSMKTIEGEDVRETLKDL